MSEPAILIPMPELGLMRDPVLATLAVMASMIGPAWTEAANDA